MKDVGSTIEFSFPASIENANEALKGVFEMTNQSSYVKPSLTGRGGL
jgi:hypothetical protein